MKWSTPHREPHRVSVVVPARNEARSIGALLDCLRAQTRAPDEIVICDGGSTDRTADVIDSYAQRWPVVRVLRAGPALPGRARNLAIQAARGHLIALTDAGTRPHPRWLERLLAPFEGPSDGPPPPDVVYGQFEPVMDSFRQRCIALAFVPPRDRHSGVRTPFVASMAMRRSVWNAVGGFREDLRSAEDLLFNRRILNARLSISYAADAVVFWEPPKDFRGAFRRFTAYSYSNICAGLLREWQLPLLRIYLLVLLLALSALWTPLGGFVPLIALAVRAIKRMVREMGIRALSHIPTIVGTALALGVIDLATFCGWGRWLAVDGCRQAGQHLSRWAGQKNGEG